MSFPDQERFIQKIRHALGHEPNRRRDGSHLFVKDPSREEAGILSNHHSQTDADRDALLKKLMEAAKPIHLNVMPVSDLPEAARSITELVAEKEPEWGTGKSVVAWRHPLVDRLDLKAPLEKLEIKFHQKCVLSAGTDSLGNRAGREQERNVIAASFVGITSADFCMADTATLVLRNRPGQPRSVALLPSIHIAVITIYQIVSDMKELFALLRWEERFRAEGLTHYMAFISGPSKTADIEATMVHGAHGPREVYLYVLLNR